MIMTKIKESEWSVNYLDIQNLEYKQLKCELCSCHEWRGENRAYVCFEKNSFEFQRNHVVYNIEISVRKIEKCIVIKSQVPVQFERLYLYLGDVRRYEYLFDGAFYTMSKCLADGNEVTETIKSVELGYFQSARSKHKIPLELNDREYKKFFLKWIKLQNEFGIINQMNLFASCINRLTADVRISMLIECYEALGKKLEKLHLLTVIPEQNSSRQVNCPNCGCIYSISIRGKKTLACYVYAIIEKYGKPIFNTEFRRRKSLIGHIIKTRNKVFHVNAKQRKVLKGGQCGFYAVKLDWLFRYIIWILMGYNQDKLDDLVSKEVVKFESEFSQLIY